MDRKEIYEAACAFLGARDGAGSPVADMDMVFEGATEKRLALLGFGMDGGRRFMKAYSKDAFCSAKGLLRVIFQVDDLLLLGTAIHSKYTYCTHKYAARPRCDHTDDEEWFLLAFARLYQLTSDGKYGEWLRSVKPQRLQMVVGEPFGYSSLEGEEARQVLELRRSGRGCLTRFRWKEWNTDGNRSMQRAEKIPFVLSKTRAGRIFALLSFVMEFNRDGRSDVDEETWSLRIWGPKGGSVKCSGRCVCTPDLSGWNMETRLGDILRKELKLPLFWGFDGRSQVGDLRRIQVRRFCLQKGNRRLFPGRQREEEVLTIDREKDCLTYRCHIGGIEGKTVIPGAAGLLSTWDGEGMFSERIPDYDLVPPLILCQGRSPAGRRGETTDGGAFCDRPGLMRVPPPAGGTWLYSLTVQYYGLPKAVWEGEYHLGWLPPVEWENFTEEVRDFCAPYINIHMLDPSVWNWRPRGKDEYIYCEVEFENGGTTYSYRTEDETIRMGDHVLVPVGPENRPGAAVVVGLEYVTADTAPYPLEKTKRIIRKI